MPNLKNTINYKEYLQSDHWKEVRRKYWASKAEKVCHFCGGVKGLSLHHKYGYRRMYEENQNHLVLLCSDCHKRLHELANWKLDYRSVIKAYKKLRAEYRHKRKVKGQQMSDEANDLEAEAYDVWGNSDE